VYWGGDEFYLYLWLFSMFMLIFLMTVYPDYIAPLFDKYIPMPEGELFFKLVKTSSLLCLGEVTLIHFIVP
jgi:STE24 endopeptidase